MATERFVAHTDPSSLVSLVVLHAQFKNMAVKTLIKSTRFALMFCILSL